MLVYKGKYNTANVMINEVEEELVSQIYSFLNHPAFRGGYIAIMPDCHVGMGSCIGFTKQMNDYIIPNVVGVDIGCGIDGYNLGKIQINKGDLEEFDNFIRKNIPSGFSIRETVNKEFLTDEFKEIVYKICGRLFLDYGKVLRAIGTLGGGKEIASSPRG